MFHWYFYPVADSYVVVAAVALALVLLLGIGPARGKTGTKRRLVLTGIRLAIILLLVAAMLRPTLVHTTTKKQSATLVILADKSRSMTVRDEINGRTRWEALKNTLDNSSGAFRKLSADVDIRAYTFDSAAHPVEVKEGQIAAGDDPDGQQTAIGAVLEDVLRQQDGKRVLGVVMLSDWAQRALPPRDLLPQTAAGRMKHLGYPLYGIRFGQARGLGQSQDVAVTELEAAPHVFVKNELSVTGQIRVDGFVNRQVPIKLLVTDVAGKVDTVAQQNIQATTDGQVISVHFSYIPQLPGEYKITLEAAQPGELVLTNNRVSTFVNVLKGGLNVLLSRLSPRRSRKTRSSPCIGCFARHQGRFPPPRSAKPRQDPAAGHG